MNVPPFTTLELALRFTLAREGGWVHDPDDSGGESNMGITWPTLRRAIASGAVSTPTTVASLTRAQAESVYRRMFWDECRCSEMPAPIARCVMDHAVHAGVGRAVRTLQAVLDAEVDGIVGFRTLAAAQAAEPVSTVYGLLGARRTQLAELIEKRPKDAKFRDGWRRRLRLLQAEALGPSLGGIV